MSEQLKGHDRRAKMKDPLAELPNELVCEIMKYFGFKELMLANQTSYALCLDKLIPAVHCCECQSHGIDSSYQRILYGRYWT